MAAYAQCPNCGHKFVSSQISGESEHGLTVVNSVETCPRCGATAQTMTGTFNFDAGVVTVLQGPEWTRDLVREMQARFTEIDKIAQSPTLDDDEARQRIDALLAELEKSNPTVVAQYRDVTEGKPRRVWSAGAKAITGALAVIGAYNTVADFADRVAELLRYFLNQ